MKGLTADQIEQIKKILDPNPESKKKESASPPTKDDWKRAFSRVAFSRAAIGDTPSEAEALEIYNAIPAGVPFTRGEKLDELLQRSGVVIPDLANWIRDRIRILVLAGLLTRGEFSGHYRSLLKEEDVAEDVAKARIKTGVDRMRNERRGTTRRKE